MEQGFTEKASERRSQADRRQAETPVPLERRQAERRLAARTARPDPAPDGRRLAIVLDEWPLVRAGVARVLEQSGWRPAGQSGDISGALRLGRELRPGLVVLGEQAEVDVQDAARALKSLESSPLILVLTGRLDAATLTRLLGDGVEGITLRTAAEDELADALRKLGAGERHLGRAFLSLLASVASQPVARRPVATQAGDASHHAAARAGDDQAGLTRKERQVLARLAEGESNREIADALCVSPATVKTHLANIYSKLGTDSRHAALARAVELGLLAAS